MNLENFGDIIALSKRRCNVSNSTDFDDIFKSAINEANLEIVKKEKILSEYTLIAQNGNSEVPEDAISIEKYDPVLNPGDYVLGNTLFTTIEDPIKIFYVAMPEILESDEDIPAASSKWYYAMTSYACYAYYLFKKKPDMTGLYYGEWDRFLKGLTVKDNAPKKIKNEYASFGGDF